MRARLLICVAASAVAAAFAAPAQGAVIVGIADNQPAIFDSPLFTGLGTKYVRLVTSYDVVARHDDELARVGAYLARAKLAGIEVLVQFEHSRGNAAGLCKKKRNFSNRVCRAPNASAYESNLRAFLNTFPSVRLIGPWNEINHFSQGTSRDPRLAAQYTKIAEKVCPGCTIVATDVLDQADNVKARHPTFKTLARYLKVFRKTYGKRLGICGLHNYSDVNRFRSEGTKALIRLLGCKQYWLTETGGQLKSPSFRVADEGRQLKAAKYMFKLVRKFRKISRLYNYSFFGRSSERFDAGLVDQDTGQARKAYAEVKSHVG